MGAALLLPTVWGVLTARRAERRSAEANAIVHRLLLWVMAQAAAVVIVPPVPRGSKSPSCENKQFKFEIISMIPAAMSGQL